MKKILSYVGVIFLSWIAIIISPFLLSGNFLATTSQIKVLNDEKITAPTNVTIYDTILELQPENLDVESKVTLPAVDAETTYYYDIDEGLWLTVENDGTNQADLSFTFFLKTTEMTGYENQNINFSYSQVADSDFFLSYGADIDSVQISISLTPDQTITYYDQLLSSVFNLIYIPDNKTVTYSIPYAYDHLYISFVTKFTDDSIYVFTDHIDLTSLLTPSDQDRLIAGYDEISTPVYDSTTITNDYSFVPNYDLYPSIDEVSQYGMMLDFFNVYLYNGDLDIYWVNTSDYIEEKTLTDPIVLTWNEEVLSTSSSTVGATQTVEIVEGLFNVSTTTDLVPTSASIGNSNVMLIDQNSMTSMDDVVTLFSDIISTLTNANSRLSNDEHYGNIGSKTRGNKSDAFYVPNLYTFNLNDDAIPTATSGNVKDTEYQGEAWLNMSGTNPYNSSNLSYLLTSITYQTYFETMPSNFSSATLVPNYADIGYEIDPTFIGSGSTSTSTSAWAWYYWLLLALAILIVLTLIVTIPTVIVKSKKKY